MATLSWQPICSASGKSKHSVETNNLNAKWWLSALKLWYYTYTRRKIVMLHLITCPSLLSHAWAHLPPNNTLYLTNREEQQPLSLSLSFYSYPVIQQRHQGKHCDRWVTYTTTSNLTDLAGSILTSTSYLSSISPSLPSEAEIKEKTRYEKTCSFNATQNSKQHYF